MYKKVYNFEQPFGMPLTETETETVGKKKW